MKEYATKTICIFSAFYPPHLGGVEVYTQSLSRELSKKGFKVCVITSQSNRDTPLMESDGDITVFRFPSVCLMGDRFPIIKPNKKMIRLWKTLRSIRTDFIVINTRYYPLSVAGLKLAKQKGIRPVLIDHSSGFLDNSKGAKGSCIRLCERLITNTVKRYRPACYGVSKRSSQWLTQLGISSLGVIPNSIAAEDFRKSASNRNFKYEFSISDSSYVVVYAGRLIAEKGVLKLIEAVKSINSKNPDIHLVIAGGGPAQNTIEKNCGNTIHYSGRLNKEDLAALFLQSDVICLPTDYPEGLPTVLLEAASCGCSLIVSQTGGTEELIPTNEYGIVISNTSVSEIENAILSVYKNKSSIKDNSKVIQKNIDDNLNWSSTAAKLIQACHKANEGY